MENLKERIKSKGRELVDTLQTGATIGAAYTMLMLAMYIPALGIHAGFEAVLNQSKQSHNATLMKRGYSVGLNTKAHFAYGEFRLNDGRTIKVMDDVSVLDGKVFLNSVIPRLQEGKNYDIEVINSSLFGHDLGYRILNAESKETQ